MMSTSNANLGILKAVEMGYTINKYGELLNKDGLILNGSMNKKVKVLRIRKEGNKFYNISFHRLQAYQKFGKEIFKKGVFVLHKNSNFLDNSNDNIILGNQSDSRMLISSEIRIKNAINATNHVKKYDKEVVRKYHEENGGSYKKTMAEFNISSKGTLHFILNK